MVTEPTRPLPARIIYVRAVELGVNRPFVPKTAEFIRAGVAGRVGKPRQLHADHLVCDRNESCPPEVVHT